MLSQHLGAPAEPVVAVGDQVKKGDLIAKAKEGALSVNIHASIDGVVKSVQAKYVQIQA
jgi:Na+-translocating ferredoxin:NAD+ oxidoreductase RnfC subunit